MLTSPGRGPVSIRINFGRPFIFESFNAVTALNKRKT